MKKLQLVMMAMLAVASVFAQTGGGKGSGPVVEFNSNYTGTTDEEWLYATKGFQDDVSKGKDPEKNGYKFEEVHTYKYSGGGYRFDVSVIQMKKASTVRATILKVYRNGVLSTHALPSKDSSPEIVKKYEDQVQSLEAGRRSLIIYVLQDMYAEKFCD